jgi:hypothetical protein
MLFPKELHFYPSRGAGGVQPTSNQRFKKVLKKGKKELGKENKVMLSLHPAREKKFVEKADKF